MVRKQKRVFAGRKMKHCSSEMSEEIAFRNGITMRPKILKDVSDQIHACHSKHSIKLLWKSMVVCYVCSSTRDIFSFQQTDKLH